MKVEASTIKEEVLKDSILKSVTRTLLWGEVIEDEYEQPVENLNLVEKFDIVKDLKLETVKDESENLVESFEHIAHCSYKTNDLHMSPKHTPLQIKWLHCDKCSYKCKDNFKMQRHISNMHTPPHLIKWFQCDQCPHKCKLKANLTSHISNRHCQDRLVKCTKCEFTTKTSFLLGYHMRHKHTPEDFRWHCCEHCSYKAKSSSSLHQHILRKHTSADCINWLYCDQCSYKARTKQHMEIHYSVHSSARQFKCNICGRDYKRRGDLIIHIKYKHAPNDLVKWYECGQCSSKFKSNSILRKHVRALHNSEVDVK